MTKKILLGFEVGSGKPVYMSLHHLIVTGLTQKSGKTTTLEALISRSGIKAIAFKTKRGEIGFTRYHEIPPYFKERSDWQYVESLIEATLREDQRFNRSWIIKACRGAKTLRDVHRNVQKLLKEARKDSLAEGVYTNLNEYLKLVIPQLEKFKFSDELKLTDGINVMDLTEMSREVQALVIRSVMEYAISNLENTVIIIPEAWEFLPQGRSTPVKLFAEIFVRKGAAIGNYLWIDSQDIAGIDKTPLRQCDNWILGRQRDPREVERTLDAIPLPAKSKPKPEDIMKLPVGHFYACLGNEVHLVYVLPSWLPYEVGVKIAKGELPVEEAEKYKPKMKEVNETVLKEKYENVLREIKQLKDENQKLRETVTNLLSEKERLQDIIKEHVDRISELEVKLDKYREIEEALNSLRSFLGISATSHVATQDLPENLTVNIEQPALTVKIERKPLVLTDKDLHGKIAVIYAEGRLNKGWFTVTDVAKHFEAHGWKRDPRASNALDDFCSWGYFEKHYAGKRPEYRVKIPVEEAKAKGLLKIEEVETV